MLGKLTGIGGIIETVGRIADSLHISGEEREKAQLDAANVEIDDYRAEPERISGQLRIAEKEAAHPSVFVAGWRPGIGWICAAGLGYQFVLYPLLLWGWYLARAACWIARDVPAPPILDIGALLVLLCGMLGLTGARTYEKLKGVARHR